MVYRMGTEGYSGQTQGCTDWEVGWPMQLQRGETGKSNDLCSSLGSSSEVLIVTKTQT